MPVLHSSVPYIIAAGIFWIVALQMAPIGREIEFSHAIMTVFAITIVAVGLEILMKPFSTPWRYLAKLLLSAAITTGILHLGFWRSVGTVLVYSLTLTGAKFAIILLAKNASTASIIAR